MKVLNKLSVLILLLAASAYSAHIDRVLRSKLSVSAPKYSSNAVKSLISSSGSTARRFYKKIHVNQLNSLRRVRSRFTYKTGFFKANVNFYPYRNFGSLMWGTKYELYGFRKKIVSGKVSYSSVQAFLGRRTGSTVEILSIYGLAAGKAKQKYNSVRYRRCRRILFWKKCRWRTKNVPRGYNRGEIIQMHNYLLNFAHRKAISVLPSRVMLEKDEFADEASPLFAASRLIPGKQVLYGVEQRNVMTSVGYLLKKSVREYSRGFSKAFGNGGKVRINKGGRYDVTLRKRGSRFDLIIQKR